MRFTTLLFCMAVAFAAAAQDYPAKPVKMLVPYAPGGATDIIARIVAQRLTESLKESFIVENRPGANGNIALEATAKAAADGYTLLVGNVSTNAINENIYADQLSIRPTRDLVGITKLVEIPHLVVANASVPAKNIAELIALAKKDPGKINFASVGMGSYPHLDMERFMKAAGILPHIKSGRLKPLAAVPAQRLPELPDVPTLAEQGFPGIGTNAWQGLFAPAATPRPVIDKLYAAVARALGQEKDALATKMLTVAVSPSPDAFNALVRRETQAWGDFVREAKIKIE